jgi:hypothetical protein
LILPYNIDLIYQERNVAESIMSICIDVTGYMKDSVNVRKDLATLCDRPSLEAKPNARGKLIRPNAPYYLKLIERKEVLRWLKTLKFLDRYTTNIKWAVNVDTGKLNGLKSHDYHIFIERLMPIMPMTILNLICGRCLLNLVTWSVHLPRDRCPSHVVVTASSRILAAFGSRLLKSAPAAISRLAWRPSSPTDGSGLLAATTAMGISTWRVGATAAIGIST